MKKICLLLALVVALFCCACTNTEMHKSSQDCVNYIIREDVTPQGSYSVEVEQFFSGKATSDYGFAEVYGFDVTITVGTNEFYYLALTKIVSGEVVDIIAKPWQGTHASYKDCEREIVEELDIEGQYEIEVFEIPHGEVAPMGKEVHCFDITITQNEVAHRYCCFSIINGDGTTDYVDCDKWGE